MNILVTGGKGQLGLCMSLECKDSENKYFFEGHDVVDITNIESIENYVMNNGIDVIVNCAAYTNVEMAEEESENEKLMAINMVGPRNLAKVCSERDLFLIQISTDFVFDGEQIEPYDEDSGCSPLNKYGLSKYFGENEAYMCDNVIVIRTSWLYSEYGKNFFKTMLNRISNGFESKVVSDQIGTPTYARDLAKFIIHIIDKENLNENIGTYHFSNMGSCSWFEFAKEIEILTTGKTELIKPCSTKDFDCKAKRPKYSVLGKKKLNKFDFSQRHWTSALKECIVKCKK